MFLSERAEAGSEPPVKALARSILAMYHLIEKRYTVAQNIKKNGPEKAASQRVEMMEFVYHAIKAYKKRTTKASASNRLDSEVLMHDYGTDLIMAGMSSLYSGELAKHCQNTVLNYTIYP